MKSLIFNSFYKLLSVSFIILPTPVNISIWWNLGSMLGLCLLIQILSGLFLSMHFCPNTDLAFMSVVHITQDVTWGWLIRMLHVNGASLYFMCMYIHIGRGVYYHSFIKTGVWFVGVMIFMLSMATAFMGYVLPWGQMSFWGATVITNLVSAIPYMGGMIVEWIWGGFSINNATLNRFYSIHFLLPFIVLMMVGLHLIILHVYGSNNPLGLLSSNYMISFHLYYTYKDVVGFLILIIVLLFICLQYPFTFSDPDNFMPANSLVTPVHIQPEWYFLFAYSILRSIPSKLGGVLALLMSILILLFLSFLNKSGMLGLCNYPVGQAFFWGFVVCFFLLTWTGARPIEYPFFEISQFLAFFYFIYFLLTGYVNYIWDSIILG